MLQGSLDNFALDEVLGLLSSTAKTGRLSLKGDRGDGSLMLNEGQLVDATASFTSNGSGPEDVVFELLRYVEGHFTFDVCEVAGADEARNILEVLSGAEGRLADWRVIEAVVPSLDHTVVPVTALPAEEITINRGEWATLRIIAAGCPASTVCEELGLGEVEGSRLIKGLADRQLVTVEMPAGTAADPRRGVDALTGSPARDPFARRPTLATVNSDDGFGSDSFETELSSPAGEINDGVPAALSARPPMPAAPGVEDHFDTEPGAVGTIPAPAPIEEMAGSIPAPPPIEEMAGSIPAPPPIDDRGGSFDDASGEADTSRDEGKPGGLLMRYLKSED